MAINRDDSYFKMWVVLLTLVSLPVKLATRLLCAYNYNPFGALKSLERFTLELFVANSKHLNFLLFLPK